MSSGFGNNDFGKILFGNTEIGKAYFGNTKVYEANAANAAYLTFSSPSAFSIKTYTGAKGWDGTLEYSTDGTSWNIWDGTVINAALSGSEYKLLMRGTNNTKVTGTSTNYRWVLTGSNISCTGNIESLLDHVKVTAGQHPSMVTYCYYHMFDGCTGLTAAPALPATTLTSYCYQQMFNNCTGLTAAPALPATALANNCYYNMFYGCRNFKVSATQTSAYTKAWRIPKNGTIPSTATDWNTGMLTNTGGTFTSDPVINTTYYVENDLVE
jgi:hypothetical protein